MDEERISLAAETLLRTHAGRAVSICTDTADRWAGRGDAEAAMLWNRILAAVLKLDQELPKKTGRG